MRHCLTYDVPYRVLIRVRLGGPDDPPSVFECTVHERQRDVLLVSFVDSEAVGDGRFTWWVDMLRTAPLVPRLVYQPG